MGERAGYRVTEGERVSPILRKQWYLGDDPSTVAFLTAKVLLSGYSGAFQDAAKIGGGAIALRHDLDIGRLAAAMYSALYSAPFDSIQFDPRCDISDHGLYDIDIKAWNHWDIVHHDVNWETGELQNSRRIASIRFTEGQTLDAGMVVSEEAAVSA